MSRHLLIGGTGRAGTSFLVRYLTHLGLDTVLSRSGSAASWDEAANAGLETLTLNDLTEVAPSRSIAELSRMHEKRSWMGELDLIRGSLHTFLSAYWPRLRRYLLRR